MEKEPRHVAVRLPDMVEKKFRNVNRDNPARVDKEKEIGESDLLRLRQGMLHRKGFGEGKERTRTPFHENANAGQQYVRPDRSRGKKDGRNLGVTPGRAAKFHTQKGLEEVLRSSSLRVVFYLSSSPGSEKIEGASRRGNSSGCRRNLKRLPATLAPRSVLNLKEGQARKLENEKSLQKAVVREKR